MWTLLTFVDFLKNLSDNAVDVLEFCWTSSGLCGLLEEEERNSQKKTGSLTDVKKLIVESEQEKRGLLTLRNC